MQLIVGFARISPVSWVHYLPTSASPFGSEGLVPENERLMEIAKNLMPVPTSLVRLG